MWSGSHLTKENSCRIDSIRSCVSLGETTLSLNRSHRFAKKMSCVPKKMGFFSTASVNSRIPRNSMLRPLGARSFDSIASNILGRRDDSTESPLALFSWSRQANSESRALLIKCEPPRRLKAPCQARIRAISDQCLGWPPRFLSILVTRIGIRKS